MISPNLRLASFPLIAIERKEDFVTVPAISWLSLHRLRRSHAEIPKAMFYLLAFSS